ncbi:MAG: diguanylate cyclase [Pseudomonadota bacterium]
MAAQAVARAGWRRGRAALWAGLALALACLAVALWAWSAGAAGPEAPVPPLTLALTPGDFPLGPHLEVLEDREGAWSVDEVSRPPLAASFRPLKHDVLNLGLSRSAYWLRLSVRSPDDAAQVGPAGFWVLDFGRAFFHSLMLYSPRPGGGWSGEESGDPSKPLPDGASTSSLRSLHLPVPEPGRQRTYYIRIQSQMVLILPLAVQTARVYLEQVKAQTLAMGLYLGVMLAMAAYNFFLFLSLRDESYLWYVCHVLGYGLYFAALNGVVTAYAPPPLDTMGIRMIFLTVLAAISFTTLFARAFLLLRASHPGWDRALLLTACVTACLAALSPLISIQTLNQTMTVIGMALPVLVLGAGWVAWRSGYRPARFFLLAWGVYGLGGIVYALTFRSVLPYSVWGFHSLQIASVIETVLLSLALADRIRTLRSSHQRLEHRANVDALTGLFNANYFRERLASELSLAQEMGHNLSLVLLDIDDFKLYNDTFGHPEGDRVLAALGDVIRTALREADLGCRYGGEEFTIILPGASGEQAVPVAERVRILFGATAFEPRPEASVRVSVCAGVAQAQARETVESLMKRADKALYQAKAEGKNCTRAAE